MRAPELFDDGTELRSIHFLKVGLVRPILVFRAAGAESTRVSFAESAGAANRFRTPSIHLMRMMCISPEEDHETTVSMPAAKIQSCLGSARVHLELTLLRAVLDVHPRYDSAQPRACKHMHDRGSNSRGVGIANPGKWQACVPGEAAQQPRPCPQ